MTVLLFFGSPVYAEEFPYKITETDTPITINKGNTTAFVDPVNHFISLPQQNISKAVGFWDTGLDYFASTPSEFKHFSFDGETMQENSILSVSGLSSPIAAAISSPYPDAVIATQDTVTHYSFTGTSMAENTALSLQGLESIVSISTRNKDAAVLSNGGINYYGFTGSALQRINSLSISSSKVTNPIDMALCRDTYDCVVLEADQAKYFNFNGTDMVENPAYAIQGLNNPLTVAINTHDGMKVSVIDGTLVKTYVLDSSGMAYSSALSVINGLNKPTSIALRPGSQDMLIVDGDEVKYYNYDGTKMIYNPYLSKTVEGISDLIGYAKQAVVQSNTLTASGIVDMLKVRAYHNLPENTSVTWAVSADGGTNWTTCWRVSGTLSGTIAELTNDNGGTWSQVGDAAYCNPVSIEDLWVPVAEGDALMWRATLATTNSAVTPKIIAPDPGVDYAIILNSNTAPMPPIIDVPDGCYLTATPLFSWTFVDADGDTQSAFQIIIMSAVDSTVLFDTGKLLASSSQFQFHESIDPSVPGPLWASGTHEFILEARVWDSKDAPSEWATAPFCILAFERPRVMEIVDAAEGQIIPDPDNSNTHIVITKGLRAENLPAAKAGSKVTILIDAISTGTYIGAQFPYASTTATLESPPICIATNGCNKRYKVSFWTSANQEICPDDTIVEAQFSDSSGASLYLPSYADGIIRIGQSMYSNWIVTLQGRN